jgi:phosphoglycolate phosphatase
MNIIFDYDGTLHDTFRIYEPAFQAAYKMLVSEELAPERAFTPDEIKHWIGYNSHDMWNLFMPQLSEEKKAESSALVGRVMIEQVEAGNARLYDGALEVLSELRKRGHTLIFLSNCKEYYMQIHDRTFSLHDYFDEMYCAQTFGFKPKSEIFPIIAKKFTGDFVAVGDRYNDIAMATENSFISIGCSYGFGSAEELAPATVRVSDPLEIISVIDSI